MVSIGGAALTRFRSAAQRGGRGQQEVQRDHGTAVLRRGAERRELLQVLQPNVHLWVWRGSDSEFRMARPQHISNAKLFPPVPHHKQNEEASEKQLVFTFPLLLVLLHLDAPLPTLLIPRLLLPEMLPLLQVV